MYLKRYDSERGLLVAACDEHLVGQCFREDALKLDVNEGFYKGDSVPGERLIQELQEASIANLVGEKTIGVAIENGFIDADSVILIGGVPHAQMVRM